MLPFRSHSDEQPFFKPGDVIAFVGGEDMVAAAEYGYIETLITRALPDYKLRFRCLAWEGDTVFEQRRDLNYPTLEQQLDKIGATVVIAQFGKMESFAGKEKVEEFMAAYEKLMERLLGRSKRRAIVITPSLFGQERPQILDHLRSPILKDPPNWNKRNNSLIAYSTALTAKSSIPWSQKPDGWLVLDALSPGVECPPNQRDGVHLNEIGHLGVGEVIATSTGLTFEKKPPFVNDPLRALIQAKNRLWHHYYRPQNWAFLAGDRTNQPSSRDHRDPSKRWFPEELEQFLPLIEQKEAEIHKLATSLARP